MLYLFDLDGTLISSYMDNSDKAYNVWHVLPGRADQLAALHAAGHRIGVVTNQAGVAFGLIQQPDFNRKWEQVCAAFGWNHESHGVAVCFAHPNAKHEYYRGLRPALNPYGWHPTGYREVDRRKPSGMMLRELMAEYPNDAAGGVLFVGDRPEDKAAAADAGVPFQWAEDFFTEDPNA